MNNLNMTIGQNIGEVLLDIAQTAIRTGNPEKAIKTYTDSLHDFTDEYAIKLLKNEYVLIVADDKVTVRLTDDDEKISLNQGNVTNWSDWVRNRVKEIMETINALNRIRHDFEKATYGYIVDYNITEHVRNYFGDELFSKVGIHNIATKLIAGDKFANVASNGQNVWDDMCTDVEDGCAEEYQKALYYIVKYVNCIRILHKEYMYFINSYIFLSKNDFLDRPQFIEANIEVMLNMLTEFSDTTKGYYHPLCNTKLYEYKESIDDDILSTEYGKEFRRCGIIEKNIMDGYDAGWLSPDGKFYGGNGRTSDMIHLRIAEKLCGDNLNGDNKLEEKGWIKIHHNEVYGSFIGNLIPDKDFPYKYCPTDIQIRMICSYADKFYNGKIYTQPQVVKVTEPISTYMLRQMDKIKLHEIFR